MNLTHKQIKAAVIFDGFLNLTALAFMLDKDERDWLIAKIEQLAERRADDVTHKALCEAACAWLRSEESTR